tara:strand:+ start:1906 stop:2403 length:498 start_codon:yes stop_codon:yes gene_type:complete
MDYKNKYYKYKQKYKNLKKNIGGGGEAPGAPQVDQRVVPNDLIILFQDYFINNVNDSLKFYLCRHENFNYQRHTDIREKILECIDNWSDHVNRLINAYPQVDFNPNLDSFYNLIRICTGNLLLTAIQGLQRLEQATQDSYLSLDEGGRTELDCTGGVRRGLLNED